MEADTSSTQDSGSLDPREPAIEVFGPELHIFPLRALIDEAISKAGMAPVETLLAEYELSPKDFADRSAWITLRFAETLIIRLQALVGETDFIEHAMKRAMTPRYIGPLYPLFVAFGTPLFTYRKLPSGNERTAKTGAWSCDDSAPGRVRMVWRPFAGSTKEKTDVVCRCRGEQIALIPTLFNSPRAAIQHTACMVRGDEACVYELTWDEPPARRHGVVGLAIGALTGGGLALAAGLSMWPSSVFGVGFAVGGWGLGRVWVLRQELKARIQEIGEHGAALDRVTQTNEIRFEELLESKAELDEKVRQRTQQLAEATDRLSKSLTEVQALDRAKTDFFNNVSHELRSPLTLILAPLEEMVAGHEPPGGRDVALAAMQRSAARLLHLINQLLDLAKVDAGEVHLDLQPVDLVALVRSVIERFAPAAGHKGVSLELREPSLALGNLLLDVSWVDSAITNLVSNALRFTPKGGGVVITLYDEGGEIAVAVADDGAGIAQSQQDRVFERFAQADGSPSVVGGTGIGLALVRETARLHGGRVKLESELGHGSTFTLAVPRRSAKAEPRSAEHRGRPLVNEHALSIGLKHPNEETPSERSGPGPDAAFALVVEDNADLREFMLDVLGSRYRVRAARDGKEGLAVARALKPDVIVSDVAMPEMDGYALCRAVRLDPTTQTIPVLLVTARADVAGVLEGFDSGADDYLLKPFHGRELLARVDVHVRLRRMVHEMALRERHATLGVIAAEVAHQVRNPLTTLVSGLPAMRRRMADRFDAPTNELVDVMIDCAGRIDQLTTDLMDVSRVDRAEGEDYRPSDGLRAAMRLVGARLLTGVTIEEEIEDGAVAHGRAGDLNHVFLNLLDNALLAVQGGGVVRVEGGPDGDCYVVRVGDSGAGIDPVAAEHIFDPFFTTRPAGEGTGLGLAIAQKVVQQQGGTIELGTSPLGGAQFTVRIPNAVTAEGAAAFAALGSQREAAKP